MNNPSTGSSDEYQEYLRWRDYQRTQQIPQSASQAASATTVQPSPPVTGGAPHISAPPTVVHFPPQFPSLSDSSTSVPTRPATNPSSFAPSFAGGSSAFLQVPHSTPMHRPISPSTSMNAPLSQAFASTGTTPSPTPTTVPPVAPYLGFGANYASVTASGPSAHLPLPPFQPHSYSSPAQPQSYPFQGLQHITNEAVRSVNHQRLTHAAATGPTRAPRAPRRGPAFARPSVSPHGNPGSFSGQPYVSSPAALAPPSAPTHVTIFVMIFPYELNAVGQPAVPIILPRFRHGERVAQLGHYGLTTEFQVPIPGTTLQHIMDEARLRLANSPFQVRFEDPTSALPHGPPPPVFYALTARNKGKAFDSHGAPLLERQAASPATTLTAMLDPHSAFMLPKPYCWMEEKFILRLVPVIQRFVACFPLREDPNHAHTCVVSRATHLQTTDSHVEMSYENRAINGLAYDHDSAELSSDDGEESEASASMNERSDMENEESTAGERGSSVPPSEFSRPPSPFPGLQDSQSLDIPLSQGLSAHTPASQHHTLTAMSPSSTVTSWIQQIIVSATDPDYLLSEDPDISVSSHLSVSGASISELADAVEELALEAAESGDCSKLLASRRTFRCGQAVGAAVENATWVCIMERRLQAPDAYWEPRRNDYMSIAVGTDSLIPQLVDPQRLTKVKAHGILVAMHMARLGLAPAPYSPFHFQYFAHNGDLRAISLNFVELHDPELYQFLLRWRDLGHEGNIDSYFRDFLIQYVDRQAGAFSQRTPRQHKQLEYSMIYRAHIARDPPSHAEIKAFHEGLTLKCRNNWDFRQAISSFEGGSEPLIRQLWRGPITGYDSISSSIIFDPPGNLLPTPLHDIAASDRLPFLTDYIVRFLRGTGTLVPHLVAQANTAGTLAITEESLADPGFRSRLFYQACTASPRLLPGQPVKIVLTEDNDPRYAPSSLTAQVRLAMIEQGAIRIAACFRTVRIPKSRLIRFLEADYSMVSSESGPQTAEGAIEFWLLHEIFSNSHSFGTL